MRFLERATPEELERVGLHTERGPESIGFAMRLYAGHNARGGRAREGVGDDRIVELTGVPLVLEDGGSRKA